jgi:prepilin peptidase CpaA
MSLFALLQIGCVAVFAALLLAAGWQDLKTMRIGNGLSLAIVATFALWALAGLAAGSLSLVGIGWSIACAVAVFVVGALIFAVGAVGGGDVKLLAAASLFAGPALQLDFLAVTAVVGGMLGLAILGGAPIGPKAQPVAEGEVPLPRLRRGLPYGPAIAAGGLWVATALVIS